MTCSTPVVFIIFRRPGVTARVFEQIRLAKPKKLFVIADGPRDEEEAILCQKAKAITERIDWDCEVFRNYSDINLGCRNRVSSGLDWAFEQVDEAIILEDDCLPNESFFEFCTVLLRKYRFDERISVVSGNNFQNGQWRGDGSYYFSCYPHCWGWATWRRSWQSYESDLSTWPLFKEMKIMNSLFDNWSEIKYWTTIFDQLFETNVPDSWAYRWTYSSWKNSRLAILPNVNLVSNIGFFSDGMHTTNLVSPLANLPTSCLPEILHPTFLVRDKIADLYTYKNNFNSREERKQRSQVYRFQKRLQFHMTHPKQLPRKIIRKIFSNENTVNQ